MTEALHNIVERIDSLTAPYVWQLRLTKEEFKLLEKEAKKKRKSDSGDNDCTPKELSEKQLSRLMLCYLGEWYRRCYEGGKTCPIETTSEMLKKMWGKSGWEKDAQGESYVATTPDGRHLWLYSTYVLGGLALRHENRRNDKRFLKQLCRIYYGQEIPLDEISDASDASRAIAFQHSLTHKQSLYHFIESVLSDNPPLESDDKNAQKFMAMLRTAEDDILRDKFYTEWVVKENVDNEDRPLLIRELRVWLKPEDQGGSNHSYIKPERLEKWGLSDVMKHDVFVVDVRLKCNGQVVRKVNTKKPLLTFQKASDEAGFLAINKGIDERRYATLKDVPPVRIDQVETVLVSEDDKGELTRETLVGSEQVSQYVQLYYSRDAEAWQGKPDAQKQTAVLWDEKTWHLATDNVWVETKTLTGVNTLNTLQLCWAKIESELTLTNDKGESVTLYNRNGYNQLATRLHTDTIRYGAYGNVVHIYMTKEDDEDEMEEMEESLPLIFGRDEIVIRHFDTKEELENEQDNRKDNDAHDNNAQDNEGKSDNQEDSACENLASKNNIEYKTPTGQYATWTDESVPAFGVVNLRITLQGREQRWKVAYLPPLEKETPIRRDTERHTIEYADMKGERKSIDLTQEITQAMKSQEPTSPTHEIIYEGEDEKFCVEVWQPLCMREVVADHEVVERTIDKGLTIPYLLHDRIRVSEISDKGYQYYDCAMMPSIFPLLEWSGGQGASNNQKTEWERKGSVWNVNELDATAPKWLKVSIGDQPDGKDETKGGNNNNKNNDNKNNDNNEWLEWDLGNDSEPQKAVHQIPPAVNIIQFRDMRKVNGDLSCPPPLFKLDPFKSHTFAPPVKAFQIAQKYGTYFFIFFPIEKIRREGESWKEKLYDPLLEREGKDGKLGKGTIKALLRLADEYNFRWEDYGVYL